VRNFWLLFCFPSDLTLCKVHVIQDLASLYEDFERELNNNDLSANFMEARYQWRLDCQRIKEIPRVPTLKELALVALAKSNPPIDKIKERLPDDLAELYHTTVVTFASENHSPYIELLPVLELSTGSKSVQEELAAIKIREELR